MQSNDGYWKLKYNQMDIYKTLFPSVGGDSQQL